MSNTTVEYADTTWWNCPIDDMKISQFEADGVKSYKAILKDGGEFTFNYQFFTIEEREKFKPKLFILDDEDVEWIKKTMQDYPQKAFESLMRLENFLKYRPDKEIYIRGFTCQYSFPKDILSFLADEVLEIIPLVLKQQGASLDPIDDRLEKYRKMWEENAHFSAREGDNKYNLVYIDKFDDALEDFDIDKELITTIPDIVHEHELSQRLLNGQKHVVTWSPYGKDMMFPSEVVYYIFRSIVCSARWNIEYCTKHNNCRNEFRIDILRVMHNYVNSYDSSILYTIDHVQREIGHLMEHCSYSHQIKDPVAERYLNDSGPEFDTSIGFYEMLCNELGIPIYPNFVETYGSYENCLLWVARTNYMIGCANYLIPSNLRDLHIAIRQAIRTKVPPEYEPKIYELMKPIRRVFTARCRQMWKSDKEPDDPITKETPKEENMKTENSEEPITTLFLNEAEKLATAEECRDLKAYSTSAKNNENLTKTYESNNLTIKSESEVEDNKNRTTTEVKETGKAKNKKKKKNKTSGKPVEAKSNTQDSSILNKKPYSTEPKSADKETFTKSPTPEPSLNESKCCPKCLRTSEMCNEAKKELKTTQNKLKLFEDKVKKFDEMEKKMKEMVKEMEKLKKSESESKKELKITENKSKAFEIKSKRNDELEMKLKEMAEEIEKVRRTNAQSDKKLKIKDETILYLKSEIQIHEETESRMKETNKKVTKSRDQLQTKVTQLEAQLKSEEPNNRVSQLERKLSENDEMISLLKETNMRVTIRNEEQAKNIQNLLNRLAASNPNKAQ